MLIKSRSDFREYLETIKKNLKTERRNVKGRKNHLYHEGLEDGFKLAIAALSAWELQQPEENGRKLMSDLDIY